MPTSKPLFPPRLEFGTLLAYPPRHLIEGENARTLIFTIKRDGPSLTPGVSLIEHFVRRIPSIVQRVEWWRLDGSWLAVPVPASRPTQSNAVWAAKSICLMLAKYGLVRDVAEIVTRTVALPVKAAHSPPGKRPKPKDHYETMAATAPVHGHPSKILLVDDVLSSGATIGGTAARIWDVLPGCELAAFAMARTVSEYVGPIDPRRGHLQTLPTYARRHDA